jgi:hypothetical protein
MDLLQVANTAYYQLGEYYGCFVRTVNVCSTRLPPYGFYSVSACKVQTKIRSPC